MNRAHSPNANLALIILAYSAGCHGEGKDESTGVESSSSTASTTTSGSSTGAQETESGSAPPQTTGTGGGMCEGPEHQDYQKAQCPMPPPSCVPALPLSKWATYCEEFGFGPVGSGECACTPQAISCGTPEGPGEYEIICCCPLEFPGFPDP